MNPSCHESQLPENLDEIPGEAEEAPVEEAPAAEEAPAEEAPADAE